jgi:hypothetical protein
MHDLHTIKNTLHEAAENSALTPKMQLLCTSSSTSALQGKAIIEQFVRSSGQAATCKKSKVTIRGKLSMAVNSADAVRPNNKATRY